MHGGKLQRLCCLMQRCHLEEAPAGCSRAMRGRLHRWSSAARCHSGLASCGMLRAGQQPASEVKGLPRLFASKATHKVPGHVSSEQGFVHLAVRDIAANLGEYPRDELALGTTFSMLYAGGEWLRVP